LPKLLSFINLTCKYLLVFFSFSFPVVLLFLTFVCLFLAFLYLFGGFLIGKSLSITSRWLWELGFLVLILLIIRLLLHLDLFLGLFRLLLLLGRRLMPLWHVSVHFSHNHFC